MDSPSKIKQCGTGWVTTDGMIFMYEYSSYEEVIKHQEKLDLKQVDTEEEEQ